jgi:hypothetical protein
MKNACMCLLLKKPLSRLLCYALREFDSSFKVWAPSQNMNAIFFGLGSADSPWTVVHTLLRIISLLG